MNLVSEQCIVFSFLIYRFLGGSWLYFKKREFRCLLSPICHNHFWQGYTYFTFADGGGRLWYGSEEEEIGKLWGNHWITVSTNGFSITQSSPVGNNPTFYLLVDFAEQENGKPCGMRNCSLRVSFSSALKDMSFSLHLKKFFRPWKKI